MRSSIVRSVTALGTVVGLALGGTVAAAPADAAPGLQARIDAAPWGATVRIPAGTFPGGITIRKSVALIGAGVGRTVLRGGDSVVRVETGTTGRRPTVVIRDLRLTGGIATGDGTSALGGGLLVAGGPDGALGAAVTLRRVAVTGNRARPTSTTPSDDAVCTGGASCPFALAAGGGIASFGDLVLDHVLVAENAATGRASDAQGGGIFTGLGSLTVRSSTIRGNRAEPEGIGRFAEGGGIFAASADGTRARLSISASTITANAAVLRTTWPVRPTPDSEDVIAMQANGGGVHIGSGRTTTIDRTAIDRNAIVAVDPAGEPAAYDSGLIQANTGSLTMTRSSVSGNTSQVVAATADEVGPNGSAMEIDGTATITDSVIADNRATDRSTAGSASDSDGLAVLASDDGPGDVTATRVAIRGNSATARSTTGPASVLGGGVLNNGLLTLRDSLVQRNRGLAESADATAQGGGLWSGALVVGPPVSLTLRCSVVTGNSLVAHSGTAQGGGVYSAGGDGVALALDRAAVRGNAPDQLFDAATAAAASAKAAPTGSAAQRATARPRVPRAVHLP